MHPLPVFDFKRTPDCSCDACVHNCKTIPGFLVLEDVIKLAEYINLFNASPGALLCVQGEYVRIPTIVPSRKEDGSCVFLTVDNRCSIHEKAPFGCRYFDCEMDKGEANYRSLSGLISLLDNPAYTTFREALVARGNVSPGPEKLRRLDKHVAIRTSVDPAE